MIPCEIDNKKFKFELFLVSFGLYLPSTLTFLGILSNQRLTSMPSKTS